MRIAFDATELGVSNGLCGASNGADSTAYHYVLFGQQSDTQHPENSGVYFEYDDQANGGVDAVVGIEIAAPSVSFVLANGDELIVRRRVAVADWESFLKGLRDVFDQPAVRIEHRRSNVDNDPD